MRLIEILKVFKPGMVVRHEDTPVITYGMTIINHEGLVEFLVSRSQEELLSDGWRVLLPGSEFWENDISYKGDGDQSRNAVRSATDIDGPEKLPFRSENLLTVLRRELDVPDRHDVIVRELWLAMQLLTSPENCADFMRRSLLVV